ncbi:MAG: hypothetical protein HPY53_06545 [Brevinematales bacterium]|nr:hypothetical protein [Brevinematales bacterium]
MLTVGDMRQEIMEILEYPGTMLDSTANFSNYLLQAIIEKKLQMMEMIDAGFTNTPGYRNEMASAIDINYYTLLNLYGNNIFNTLLTNGKFLIARASHILLNVPETANVGGHFITLTPGKKEEMYRKQEKAALEKLAWLKASKHPDTDFAALAEKISDDPGSSGKGGDLGYFSQYTFEKEFSGAVFGMKTEGLVPQPVKTKFGWHIIYVTDPPKMMSYAEVEKETGVEVKYIWYSVETGFKKEKATNFYTVDKKTSLIGIGGKTYTLENLPPGAVLMEIWGEPYSWEKCRKIIDIFVPGFSRDITIEVFGEQMNNCAEFMLYAEKALQDGAEKTAEFQDKITEAKELKSQDLCVSEFLAEMYRKAKMMILPGEVLEYYKEHMNTGEYDEIKKDIKGGIIMNKKTGKPEMETIPFEKLSNAIASQKMNQYQGELYTKWKETAMKKYQVEFSDTGIGKLYDAVREDYEAKLNQNFDK